MNLALYPNRSYGHVAPTKRNRNNTVRPLIESRHTALKAPLLVTYIVPHVTLVFASSNLRRRVIYLCSLAHSLHFTTILPINFRYLVDKNIYIYNKHNFHFSLLPINLISLQHKFAHLYKLRKRVEGVQWNCI